MNKLLRVLPIVAFLFAAGSALMTEAGTKRVTYYRWNASIPTQCDVDDCVLDAPKPCGHMSFTASATQNCGNQISLKRN